MTPAAAAAPSVAEDIKRRRIAVAYWIKSMQQEVWSDHVHSICGKDNVEPSSWFCPINTDEWNSRSKHSRFELYYTTANINKCTVIDNKTANISDKNCSLSIVLTAMDQKLQKP